MSGKIHPEDYRGERDYDPFLQLLLDLWSSDTSVNQLVLKRELRVYPSPNEDMTVRIRHHFETLRLWLPGECDNCHGWVMQRTEFYSNAHAHLCRKCLDWCINFFEENDRWPDATWHEGEE